MAFLAYQVTGESWDSHDDDPLVLWVLCRCWILKLILCVVKIPAKQDIHISWWVACGAEYITSIGGNWRPERLCEICLLSRGGLQQWAGAGSGGVVGLKHKTWVNCFNKFQLVIYFRKCYIFQYLWLVMQSKKNTFFFKKPSSKKTDF